MYRPVFMLIVGVVLGNLAAPAPARANGLAAGHAALLLQDAFSTPQPADLAAKAEADPPLRFRLSPDLFLPQQPLQGAVPTPQAKPGDQPSSELKKAKFSKVLQYSIQLIFYKHVMRVTVQPFTRAELDGPFWKDYLRSVKMPKKWGDGDSWEVNYIGHSMSGSSGVRLWLNQREPEYQLHGKKEYWKAMGRAFLFSILYSEQFEIGPLSEASIGNVGLREGRTGWSDHIITPVGSVFWTILEDQIDKYVVTWIERHVPFNIAKVAARVILCPAWMLANVGQNRLPWSRPGRPVTGGR